MGVSVCLPARDEAATVASIVSAIRGLEVVGEVVVVDDGSRDATAAEASAAGAVVVAAADVLADFGASGGKGAAMWKAVHVSTGDVICFVDADIEDFDPTFVERLAAPLLDGADVGFVKGHYRRDGGRVTELVARPLLDRLLPHLARFPQPLSGELAARRSVLEALPFEQGWGVDIGLLADATALLGPDAVALADLGTRTHKHRPLDELRPQAEAVLDVVLDRAAVLASRRSPLPPLASVAAYRRRWADSA